MIVKIDNRELPRHCQAVKHYVKNHKIIIEELPIGDFIFSDNKTEVVFEYKTLTDFKNSVQGGRIFDQALRQKKNFKHHFIIVEVGNYKLIEKEIYYEAIASLNTFTTVLLCPSLKSALTMMEIQAEKSMENNIAKKPIEKTENVAYNYLTLIKGINKIKAKNICDKYQLNTFEDLRTLTAKKLVRVSGIGSITAYNVMKSIKLS